jgi:hypothetical protein
MLELAERHPQMLGEHGRRGAQLRGRWLLILEAPPPVLAPADRHAGESKPHPLLLQAFTL